MDPLFVSVFVATIVGARLGHCIFYQPDYYFGSWSGFLDKIPMPDDATLDMLAASVNPERLGNHPEALTTAQLRAIYVQAFTPMTDTERAEAIAAWEQYGK